MENKKKIYITVAGGGNPTAQRHYRDTIEKKRSLGEIRKYLSANELKNLKKIYPKSQFIVWGAVPGPSNEPKWERMNPGDFILIYNQGFIKYVGEIAYKVRSKKLAKYFWGVRPDGKTWELIYFIRNEKEVNIPFSKVNKLLGYAESFRPQGFTNVDQVRVDDCIKTHGDLRSVLHRLEKVKI